MSTMLTQVRAFIPAVCLALGFGLWFATLFVYPAIGAGVIALISLVALLSWFRRRNPFDLSIMVAIGVLAGAAAYALGVILSFSL